MEVSLTQQDGNYAWYQKLILLSRDSEVMDIRKQSTTAILLQQNGSLIHSKSYSSSTKYVQLQLLINEAFLYSKQRTSKKTTTRHNTDFNGSLGYQVLWTHLHHRTCIYGSGNVKEERQKDYATQNTRKSVVKQPFLGMFE